MATIVLLAALIATAVARPQAVQFVQAPAGLASQQFLSLVPFNGVNNLPVQNQMGQVLYLQPGAGVSPFGSGSTVLLQVPSNPAPSFGSSVFAVPMAVAPSPAPVIVKQEPVTSAPVTLPPPPPPTTTTPAPLPVVVPAVKPQVAVVENVGPAKYSYSYEVNDPSTGDSKSAAESRDGNKVTGFYTVVDPDGVNRKVQYTADENGFVAQVLQTQSGVASAVKVAPPVVVSQQQIAPVLLVPATNPTQVSAASAAKTSAQFTSPSFSYKWGSN